MPDLSSALCDSAGAWAAVSAGGGGMDRATDRAMGMAGGGGDEGRLHRPEAAVEGEAATDDLPRRQGNGRPSPGQLPPDGAPSTGRHGDVGPWPGQPPPGSSRPRCQGGGRPLPGQPPSDGVPPVGYHCDVGPSSWQPPPGGAPFPCCHGDGRSLPRPRAVGGPQRSRCQGDGRPRPTGVGARPCRSLEDLRWAAAGGHPRLGPRGLPASSGDPRCQLLAGGLRDDRGGLGPSAGSTEEPLPFFAIMPRQWGPPLPSLSGYAIRGLREKLRLRSNRAAEANKPLRPQGWPAGGGSCPAEITEKAARRLRIRRQNSTPSLGRDEVEEAEDVEAAAAQGGGRCRVHIPSFEEFKKMRKKNHPVSGPDERGGPRESPESSGPSLPPPSHPGLASPVCTGPAPGSPLHTVAVPCLDLSGSEPSSSSSSSSSRGPETTGPRDPHCPEKNWSAESQSTCCPSLLLEAAADLSAYGVTLQQMKNGLIGSAIDLIKKSCTADSAATEAAHQQRQLDDITVNERNSRSGPVSTATLDGSIPQPVGGPRQADCCSLPSCRRSSSDAAYGTTETVKAQRECRLRPHFSDPMPADAAKRKQLEMRIAAAAWGLGQKRRQDKESGGCPLLDAASRVGDASPTSEPRGDRLHPGSSHRPKHRWSNLSTDSGVVGLNDRNEEREEEEEEEAGDRGRKSRPGEVERADSGIGPGTAKKWRSRVEETARSVQAWVTHQPCVDCGERDAAEAGPVAAGRRRESLCGRCAKRRRERKEAILELVNTESSYGEDLRIIREEFQLPMQAAGLLTPEQLAVVFSNIHQLIEVNEKFLERLQDSTEQAFDQNDEDFLTVCIGEMFLEFVNMLPAFQTYCIHQSSSINLLNSLEKEKELLRIFLDVSQNDNTALRRMNLRSFLMAPLQRVTKYPLLLSRISSSTPEYHPDHRGLREAKSRVESHLEHINMKSRQEGAPLWPLRSLRRGSRRHREAAEVEMREVAVRAVGWPREETRFAMEGTLQSSQPSDGQWAKKGSRSLKFHNLHALLVVNRAHRPDPAEGDAAAGSGDGREEAAAFVRDAALVLMRDKSGGKFSLFRRPIHLGNCVVSSDPDCEDTFELLEIPKEAFVFRDADRPRTRHWFRLIKRYSQDLGSWRKRRNALPNIMINATHGRS
ncbi:uncharacterized protein arhgef49 [Rhinoraja longicauda]